MKDRIQSLLSEFEKNTNDEEILHNLEDLVTGDESDEYAGQIADALEEGRKSLVRTGRFNAALKILELEQVVGSEDESSNQIRLHSLMMEEARIKDEELLDSESALLLYEKIEVKFPDDSDEAKQKLETINAEKEKFENLVDKFCEQAEEATDDELKSHMLYSAAERLFKYDKENEKLDELLFNALDADPNHVKAARLLERILKQKDMQKELADLYLKLSQHRSSKDERILMLQSAAHIFNVKLEDTDSAALCYQEILDLVPGDQNALKFLVQMFEKNEDWDHLVSLYEDNLKGKLNPQDEAAMLMQAGMVHWKMRDDMEKAEPYFGKLKKRDPAHRGMINFYRTFLSEKNEQSRLVDILSAAQRSTTDQNFKDELTKEIAQKASVDDSKVEKAIDAWKAIFVKDPQNGEAQDELKKLYRKSEKWNALLGILKTQADALPKDDVEEKPQILFEIASIYKDKLSFPSMVIATLKNVLEIDPSNKETILQLTKIYEDEKRWNDLINILSMQASSSEDPDEKVELLKREADLWLTRFNNFNRAIEPLEEILKIDSSNSETINMLKSVYQKRRAWRPLLELMEKEAGGLEEDEKKACLVEMAILASSKLMDRNRAISLWNDVLLISPGDMDALDELEKLTERIKDWDGLTEVLTKQLEAKDDDNEKAAILLKLGTVMQDRIKDPKGAASAWKQLLSINPGHKKAMRSLREAYLASKDWESIEKIYAEAEDYEGLVEVLGITADRSTDDQIKIELSFKCADFYEDPIGQPDRSVRHYERVLSVDESNERAARALLPIYKKQEKFKYLVDVMEVVLEHTEEKETRLELMREISQLALSKINNPNLAYEYSKKSFEENTENAELLEEFESSAAENEKLEEFIEVITRNMEKFDDDRQLEIEKHLADLAHNKLGKAEMAISAYQAVLSKSPGDNTAVKALDGIFRSASRWEDLLGIYNERINLADDDEEKRDLIVEKATLYEDAMDDLENARKCFEEALELFEEDKAIIEALERIYRITEAWKDLKNILEKRRDLTNSDNPEWEETSYQLGEILDVQLEDYEASIEIYKEIIEHTSGNQRAVEKMERFLRIEDLRMDVAGIMEPYLEQNENFKTLAWVLTILIEGAEDSDKHLELTTKLSDLYCEKLDDKQVAFETLGAALTKHPGEIVLWDKLTQLAFELAREPELAGHFADAYSQELDDELELELARRLFDIFADRLGKPEKASKYAMRILDDEPTALEPFTSLETLYTGLEKWDDLLSLYRKIVSNPQIESPVKLHLKICFILEEIKHDVEEAINENKKVLELEPDNSQATRSLGMLYEEAGRWEDLYNHIESQLDGSLPDEAIKLRYNMAEILEHQLKDTENALDMYRQVLSEDSDHLKAQEALERLLDVEDLRLSAAKILEETYEKQGAAEPLARVLSILLEDEELDDLERVQVLSKIADLKERRLSMPGEAFDAYAKALGINPSDDEIVSQLDRLSHELSNYEIYCDILNNIISGVSDDNVLAGSFMSKVALIYKDELQDMSKAKKAYKRLLDNDPDNPDTAFSAIDALGDILTAEESWEELLEVLSIKVRLTSDSGERIDMLHRIAEIQESALEDYDGAVSTFRQVIEIDDTEIRALIGLERLFEHKSSFVELIDILRKRAQIEESDENKKEILLRVAKLYDEELCDNLEAIAAYSQILDETGPDLKSLNALSTLFEKSEKWADLLETLESMESVIEESEKADLFFKMGEILRTKTDEPEQAIIRLGNALELNPGMKEAITALEGMLGSNVRLEVVSILKPIYESDAAYEKILQLSDIEVNELDDPLERFEVLKNAAEVAEVGLEQSSRAFELLGRALCDGAAASSILQTIDNMERLADQVDDGQEKLLEYYKQVVSDIMDIDIQVRLFLRIADILKDLQDMDGARDYFIKVLDVDSENTHATNALEAIYEQNEQYPELFETLRRKINSDVTESKKVEMLFKQARICEVNLEDVSQAANTYETILEYDPGNIKAIDALERLFPELDRWADMVDLLERKIEHMPSESADIYHRLATISNDKLGDDDRAMEYFRQVLKVDSGHAQTLSTLEDSMEDDTRRSRVAELLEPVYMERSDWPKLVETLNARFEYCDDPEMRKDLLRRIGTHYEEQLQDLEKAFDSFLRLFKEDIEDKTTWDILFRLASVLESWEKLAETYQTSLDDMVGDTPGTAELAFILGEICEVHLQDPKKAKSAYKRTLAFSPDDPKAFSAVERMFLATESWPELLELYRDAADTSADPDNQKEYIFKIAEIYDSKMEDPPGAIDSLSDILAIDEMDERAASWIQNLYTQTERFEDLAMHFRTQADIAEDMGVKNEFRCRLAMVHEEHLDDKMSALDIYEEALTEGGEGSMEARRALERLILDEELQGRIADILEPVYRLSDEWKQLVVILKAQVKNTMDPITKREKLKEIASLHENKGQNYMLAFKALSESFAEDPSDSFDLDELLRLAQKVEAWDELAEVLDDTCDEIGDLELKLKALKLLGEVYDVHLDSPRKAIESYLQVVEINSSDNETLNKLDHLYNMVSDWEGVIDILSKKVLSADPEEQVKLLSNKASVYEELLLDSEEAIASFLEALDVRPDSLETMRALERLYGEKEKWVELIDTRRRMLDVLGEPELRISTMQSIALVYEEKLDDTHEAINAWQAVLDEDSGNMDAMDALNNLFEKESMYSELMLNLLNLRSVVQDQAVWIDLSMRTGKLREEELSDLEGAVENYSEVLAQNPTHADALEALERLLDDEMVAEKVIEVLEPVHRDASRWDKLSFVLEKKIEISDDSSTRLTGLLSLAEVYEVGMSDMKSAFNTYGRALKENAKSEEIFESLQRIAAGENLYKELADVYASRADDVYDATIEADLLARVGVIRETHLADSKGAILAFRRSLETGNDNLNVLSALDRLYQQEAMWPELCEIIGHEVEIAQPDEADNLKLRMAVIQERELGDISGAVSALRSILETNYDNMEAVAAGEELLKHDNFVQDIVEILRPVYESRNENQKIAVLYEHLLRVADDDTDRVRLFKELALFNEENMSNPDGAFDALSKAFSYDPGEVSILDDLERLAESLGSWSSLVNTLEKTIDQPSMDPVQAVELGLKVAKWASTKVGDPAKAEKMYRNIIEKEPEHAGSLYSLDQLLRTLGRFEDLIPIIKQRAEISYDFEEKKKLYIDMAKIAQFEIGDAQTAIDAYNKVLEQDETDVEVIEALILLVEEGDDVEKLASLLAALTMYTNDPLESNKIRHRLAAIYLGPMNNYQKGVDVFCEILQNNPEDEDAVSNLLSLYEQNENWTDLQDLYMSRLDFAKDNERKDVLKKLAFISEAKFDSPEDAISSLQEAFILNSGDKDVSASLVRLYTAESKWPELVEHLEEKVASAVDSNNDKEELNLLAQMGEILNDKLLDSQRASEIYEQILERDPEHTRTFAALSKIYEANGEWEKCVDILKRAAETGKGGEDEAEVHYRLAVISESHFDNIEEAQNELLKCISLFPAHVEANSHLVEIYKKASNFEALVETYLRQAQNTQDNKEKVERLLLSADILNKELDDKIRSKEFMEKAKELDPDNADVLLKLSDVYILSGQMNDAVQVLLSLIQVETDGGKKRSRKAAVYHKSLSNAYVALGDNEKALENLEKAYKLDISNVEVLAALGKMHYEAAQYDKAAKLFRALLLQRLDPSLSISKADVYWYVGDISLKKGENRKAKGMFQRGLDEDREHAKCKESLADL